MTEAPKRGRGRPRREGAEREILSVALELLRERGYRGFTFDALTERTGIAKTTIYRRWPSKASLIAAAMAPLQPPADADPATIARDTASVLALLAEPDADALDVIRAAIEPRRAQLQKLVADPAHADAIIGALVVQLIFGETLVPRNVTPSSS